MIKNSYLLSDYDLKLVNRYRFHIWGQFLSLRALIMLLRTNVFGYSFCPQGHFYILEDKKIFFCERATKFIVPKFFNFVLKDTVLSLRTNDLGALFGDKVKIWGPQIDCERSRKEFGAKIEKTKSKTFAQQCATSPTYRFHIVNQRLTPKNAYHLWISIWIQNIIL